jgi:hypothetical protein
MRTRPTTSRGPRAASARGDGGYVTDVRLPVVLAVGVLIVVVAVLAIRIAYGASADEAKPRVLVLGDSITDHGQRELRDTIGPLYALSIEGQDNFRVDEQLPAAQRWATREFRHLVINLGTNDIVQGWPLDATAASLEELVALFPDVPCVHLTTVALDLGSARSEQARALNEAIDAMASQDRRIHIVDWAEVVASAQDRGQELTSDGVHPTDEGQRLLADAYEESMMECGDG